MGSKTKKELTRLVEAQLKLIGEDPSREGLRRTPLRVAQAFEFLTSGYKKNLKRVLNEALFDATSDEMVKIGRAHV